MFKNSNEEDYGTEVNGVEDTLIGSSIKIEGDLVSNGSINVEGEVVGSLKTEKRLKVGEKAKVVADVKAQEAYISGVIQGNLNVAGKVELTSTARVNGDIQATTLTIAAGAIFNGKSTMPESALGAMPSKSEAEDEE